MKINQQKMVQVDVKTLKIHCKVRDQFTYALEDSQGDEVFVQEDGYVPDFMPGDHYGDYVILDIDLESGQILNWTAPTVKDLESAIKTAE